MCVRTQRGFILIVVIGLLAVLLGICIGFLSYTRMEVNAVDRDRLERREHSSHADRSLEQSGKARRRDLAHAQHYRSELLLVVSLVRQRREQMVRALRGQR